MSMINYDVKKIYEWPFTIQFIVVGLVAFILLYLGYIVDIASLKTQIISGYATELELKQQLNAAYSKQITAATDMAEVPKLLETLNQWQTKIISEGKLPEVQEQILKFGQQNQLKFTTFNPAPPVKDGDYQKIPITISTNGTFNQVATLLSQIANMNYLVKITDFTIGELAIVQTNKPVNTINPTNTVNPASTNSATQTEINILNSDTILKADLNLEIYRK